MTDDWSKSASTLGIPDYEVLGCEPLHDITNVVQNIITELPHHIENKDVQKEFVVYLLLGAMKTKDFQFKLVK